MKNFINIITLSVLLIFLIYETLSGSIFVNFFIKSILFWIFKFILAINYIKNCLLKSKFA